MKNDSYVLPENKGFGQEPPDADQALADAAAELGPPTDEALASVAELARGLTYLEDKIRAIEDDLKAAQNSKRLLETQTLPERMRALGLSEYALTDGTVVGVRTVVSASVSAPNRPAANGYLRSIGEGDLIKHTISAKLIRGQEQQAIQLLDYLKKLGVEAVDDERVHPQTMSAWVRNRVLRGEGDAVPKDLFGVFIGQVATVTRPKQ